MEENKKTQDSKKLSYEELEYAAQQLSVQLQKAQQQIGQMSSVLTRLPYLFKVVELGDKCFNMEFVVSCAAEIEDLLALEEETTEDKGKDKDKEDK